MSYITDYDESFETVAWTDKREARRILNDAKNMIATNPSKSDTYQAVHTLWLLIPNGNSEVAQQASDYILRQ